jgi:hypothetical protein
MILTGQSASSTAAKEPNRMTNALTNSQIDSILSWQFTVAWAGEGKCQPKRLGWWQTDLVDREGGGDLLQRLFPKTHEWAALEAVRDAAIAHDRSIRQDRLAQPDWVNTLFFWGFNIDEQLADRLIEHKCAQEPPATVLDLPLDLGNKWVQADLEAALSSGTQPVRYEVEPAGRAMEGKVLPAYELRSQKLASALLPLADNYPMPFYRIDHQLERA